MLWWVRRVVETIDVLLRFTQLERRQIEFRFGVRLKELEDLIRASQV